MCDTIHPFELRGLGKAPFRYLGPKHQEIVYGEAVVGSAGGVLLTTKPGGTCDNCGQYILAMYRIESSDGKISTVGCDCILKLGRADNQLVTKVKADKLAHDRKVRLAKKHKQDLKDTAQIAAAFNLLDESQSLRDKFEAMPHPKFKDSNALAYITWMRRMAGRTGCLTIAKMIEDAAK